MDSEIEFTPPEIRETANLASTNLLPDKSKLRYIKSYDAFKNWCQKKQIKSMPSENVMLAYFSELAKNKKPSTLWATYSMLRTTLNINDNIDISKFSKLIAFIKKQNVGYKPKKSLVFGKNDIDKFLAEAPLEYLPLKVNIFLIKIKFLKTKYIAGCNDYWDIWSLQKR